jgi:hypothetical protein
VSTVRFLLPIAIVGVVAFGLGFLMNKASKRATRSEVLATIGSTVTGAVLGGLLVIAVAIAFPTQVLYTISGPVGVSRTETSVEINPATGELATKYTNIDQNGGTMNSFFLPVPESHMNLPPAELFRGAFLGGFIGLILASATVSTRWRRNPVADAQRESSRANSR